MPLLMIPGPIECSPAVIDAASGPPPGHLAPAVIEDLGASISKMREVWLAASDAQPFVVAGSGTLAMEMAATNLLDPGLAAVVASSGYFSERMAEMLRRRGVKVTIVVAEAGDAPELDAVAKALDQSGAQALFATHVDTSSGVRVDVKGLAALARSRDILSVFDGVCATAAERFEMASLGADVYLTASQKAIGLPAGLALLVASRRAMDARARLETPPPLSIDFQSWEPIMKAYEARKPSYFSTPATTLIRALRVSLDEILAQGMEARFAQHARVADGMRAAWASMGLSLLPVRTELAANTLSAVRYPKGVGPAMVADVAKRGVVVAGGLLPALKEQYFRVGHMGDVLNRRDALEKTVRAVADALASQGHPTDADAAVAALFAA